MGFQSKTLDRMDRRTDSLIAEFPTCLKSFAEANLFTGPSLHFHLRTLAILQECGEAVAAIERDDYLESLYATLASWGMHRMGPSGAKLVDLATMKQCFLSQRDSIRLLQDRHILRVRQAEVPVVAANIWKVIEGLSVGVGKTRIVAGSKALHHVLPELVPPIDREYTVRFFLHSTTLSGGDKAAFIAMYPLFHRIGSACSPQIQAAIGTGMNTSFTKVIDNAIVGFGLRHLRRKDI